MDEVVASQKFRLDSGASWELQGFDPWKNENLPSKHACAEKWCMVSFAPFFEEHTIMNFMFSLTLALNLGLTARGGVACA